MFSILTAPREPKIAIKSASVSGEPQYFCANYQTLVAVDALEAQLQQLPGVVSTTSLTALSK